MAWLIYAGPTQEKKFAVAKENLELRLTTMMGGEAGCATDTEIKSAVEKIAADPAAFKRHNLISFQNCAVPVFGSDLDSRLYHLRETFPGA